MSNSARDIIRPSEAGIFRTVFLYVGQGDATLLAIPSGQDFEFMLIDTNLDEEREGIDMPRLLSDLLDGELQYFVNTHPHKDHLTGLAEIRDAGVEVKSVWHSGHKPGADHKEVFEDLEALIKELGDENVTVLEGTRDDQVVGDVSYNVLAPAEYVTDEIEGEKPEERAARIHEQCAVIRFRYGQDEKQVMITGDADLDAWQKHIAGYHSGRLSSVVLSAPHHGSRSFFVRNEGDEPYVDHIESIQPTYAVISAPRSEESEHGHPHEDAVEEYKKYVEEDNLIHLGKDRECVIVDIRDDGEIEVRTDDGQLVEDYCLGGEGKGPSGSYARKVGTVGVVTKLDDKPMG